MNEKPSLLRTARDQKRVAILAVVLAAAALWVFVSLGDWQIGLFLAIGVAMGLVNHLFTEMSLLRMIESGQELTRSQIASSAFFRLLVVSGVAVAVAVVFWSVGLVTLIGLALFRLITLVMTGIPLLKELSNP